ncbi:MAG: hypothetical protein JXO48_01945 [Deltaproteobacteria bacterium]|nr:hypothetical protein [Deltaproteobacteria bacterium]
MKKILVLIISVLMLFSFSGSVNAFETGGSLILKDTLFGTVTGAVIGAAVMAFTEDPGDHLMYIGYGAASGAIVGMLFGVYEATAIVEIEKGDMKIALPTPQWSYGSVSAPDTTASIDIVRVRF